MTDYSEDYLLDKQIKILQPLDGYRASSDAVLLSSLVHTVKKGDKILDIGSGTGAISLCLSHRFPQAAITGLEIQPRLAELSNMSASINNFNNLHYINCDIRHPQSAWFNAYDHVITNPPYAADDMPSPNLSKLQAHNFQHFSLPEWLNLALKCLRPLGRIYTVNRAEAIDDILSVFHGKAGAISIIPLYSKSGQQAKRVLVCARKGDKTPSRILPPLIVHQPNGEYTELAHNLLRKGYGYFD